MTLERIMTQLDSISGNLKAMDGRISDNEHDVMKLFRFLRQDLTMRQTQIESDHQETTVQDLAEYGREWVNTVAVEKPMVTKEFVDQPDFNQRTLGKGGDDPINIMNM
jgi:hypothetical protein